MVSFEQKKICAMLAFGKSSWLPSFVLWSTLYLMMMAFMSNRLQHFWTINHHFQLCKKGMKGVTVMDENHSSLTGLNKLTNVLIEASFNFSKIGPSLQVKILKKIFCIVRESNPGRPRGRRAFYHWTNDAFLHRFSLLGHAMITLLCCVNKSRWSLYLMFTHNICIPEIPT